MVIPVISGRFIITRRLEEQHIGIYYGAALECGFARGRDDFFGSVTHESGVDSLSQIFVSLAEETVRKQLVETRPEIGFRVLALRVAVFYK